MRTKISFLSLLVLCLLLGMPRLTLADDPGNRDSCRVECLDVTLPQQQIVVQVSVYNDEDLGGVAIPLAFGSPPLDVVCDSVSFAGTRVENAEYLGANMDALGYKLVFYAIFVDSNLTPGDGAVANLYFTAGPDWDSTLCVQIDTTFYPPTTILEFTPRATGQALFPDFKKGCLGSGIVPVPELVAPADSANVCSPDTHELVWSKSQENLFYTLQYAEDPNFTTGVVTVPDLWDTTYAVELSRGTYYWHVMAGNLCGKESPYQDQPSSFYVFESGDATSSGDVGAGDIVYIINYLFRQGDPPVPFESGDASCDGDVSANDIVWLISYLYRNGPAPCCP
ncbi:MAG: hypothetical protein GTO24_10275 [candidate division Zixibacteria bacterium]|nr:hypothetical protein [candidate division Zixibacteria bacterium]